MEQKKVYLDNNGTTPLHPEVKKIIVESLDTFGNPSSFHSVGREARKYIEEARSKTASFIGASSDDIIFVGSGSEANNTVLNNFNCGTGQCAFITGKPSVLITTKIEHPCILETARCLHDRGLVVKYLDVDQYGKIHKEQLKEYVKQGAGLVSVMMANNEIGTIQDIKEIAALCHEYGILFHTDAAQAVGKIKVDVKDLDVDFLTLSGHKVYGPKGIGVLYIKKNTPFCPFIRGGHQERGRRAGTENTLGIIALGKAIEMRSLEMESDIKRFLEYKELLKNGISENIKDVWFNGHPTDCLPNTLNVSFDGSEGEAILLYLDMEGISVSTGSACASGSLDPSHVLMATGVPVERAHGSIRISMGRTTTRQDIEYVVDALIRVIAKIRKMSSAYVAV